MISFGARFGAPAIIGSMQGNVPAGAESDQVFEWLGEGLTTLAQHAQREGVKLIYEPLNRYETNLLNTQEAAAAFLYTLGSRNIALLADLFHMNIEEQSLPDTIRRVGSHIGHVHFADSNRRPVGMGHTAMHAVAASLKEIGYDGYMSAEAFPWPNPDEAAAQTIRAFNQFFRNTEERK
jgi:sugar phosphate isomerase/epimerase